MKNLKRYYILNVVTDQNFDPIENKFYSSNWTPELEEKSYLKILIKSDKVKFKNCKIVKL